MTGHGLKDIDAALRGLKIPEAIEPTEEGLETAAKRLRKMGVGR